MKTNKLPEIIRDTTVVSGAVAVTVGLGMVSLPLALIVAGLLLAGIGIAWQLDIEHKKAAAERDRRRGI